MSLRDKVKKSMEEARKKVEKLQESELTKEEIRNKGMDEASKVFIPVKNALDALSEEFSENSTIEFIYKDYIATLYEILIKTENERYEIGIQCVAFSENCGFRFSYCLNVKEAYSDKEFLHTYFDEGKEWQLLDKLMLILANYEANGFISYIID